MSDNLKKPPKNLQKNLPRFFMYWAISVFFIKVAIILQIDGVYAGSAGKMFFVDGAWLGADGENYLTGLNALLEDGIFSNEGLLNYWPAGYPLFMLFLSIFGKSWLLTTLSFVQSFLFSYAAYLFATQLYRTRLKYFSYLTLLVILLNPTLSLNSISIGYESIAASGILIIFALIIKSFIGKSDENFFHYLIVSAFISSLLVSVQPRLIVTCLVINFAWIIAKKGAKASVLFLIVSLAITLIFPTSLIYRNNKAVGLNSISTNLGVTMNIGAGDNATGGYMGQGYGVPCNLSGNTVQQDGQRVRCVLDWYLKNPSKAVELFYNKSIYFWSPWVGPLANGTMARNPWLNISPLKSVASTQKGYDFIFGPIGKSISWLWLLGGLFLMFHGFLKLWRLNSLERFIASIAMVIISTNWLISLISIGDHRFRVPIMGASLFLQVVGLKSLIGGRKVFMVDGPSLR